MKKRLLSLMVALLLLGQMVPALAADPSNENPILPTQSTEEEFVIEDGKLVKYNGKATEIVVPDGVTEIGGGAFTWASPTSVSLPDSVTKIEPGTFSYCQKLTSFTVPAGVTKLGDNAISNCPALYHVDIHDGVTSIGPDNFRNCPALEQVYIPASVTSIGMDAFEGNRNLVIYGASGTRAETYAQEHNIPFVAVASPSEVPAPRLRYPDVSREDWYYEAIETMSEGGLLTGYDNGNFGPNDIITKGQFATILCRIGGLDTDNANYKPRYFKHTAGIYEQPYDWATQAISSIWNTMTYMIAPESSTKPAFRGEAISIMNHVAHRMPQYYENGHVTIGDMKQISEKVWTEADIPDWDEIEKAAEDASMTGSDDRMTTSYILHAYNLGITQGIDENGTCNPTGTLTRAEVCQLLYNMGIKKEDQVGLGGAFVGG